MPYATGTVVRCLLLAVVYVATGLAERNVVTRFEHISAIWWPVGFALAAALVYGRRVLPGVFVGECATMMLSGESWKIGVCTGVGNMLEVAVARHLLTQSGFDPKLARVRDVLSLAVAAAASPSVLLVFQGAAYLTWGWVTWAKLPPAAAQWWASDAVAFLLVTPLGLTLYRVARHPVRAGQAAGWGVTFAFLGGISLAAFRGGPAAAAWQAVLAPATFPFLIVAALRGGPPAAVAAVTVHVAAVVGAVLCGVAPVSYETDAAKTPVLYSYLAVTGLTAFLLAAAVAEAKAAEEQRRAASQFESLGVLAGGVAHEFNNLMTRVMGGAGLVKMLAPDLPPNLTARLTDIENAAARAAELTRNLLAYAGKGFGRHDPIDLAALARAEADRVRPELPAGTTLCVETAPGLPWGQGERRLVELAVANVLRNAVEAHAGRAGEIRVAVEQDAVTREDRSAAWAARDAKTGPAIRVRITDRGAGIPADLMTRVCEPFAASRVPGRGLGLAAALGVVRAHRGLLRIATREGVGTTVDLVFPIPRAGPSSSVSTSASRAAEAAAATAPAGVGTPTPIPG